MTALRVVDVHAAPLGAVEFEAQIAAIVAESREPAGELVGDRPTTLVVPDGNWRQARRMATNEAPLARLVAVRLPEGPTRRFELRKHPQAERLSTFEAIARALESGRIGFRMHGSTESEARATVGRYPEGSSVTVHYSPDDPSVACLEPGTGDLQWLPLAIGAFCVVMGAGIAWFVPRMIDARAQAVAR